MKRTTAITIAIITLFSALSVSAAPVYTDNVAPLLKELKIMQGDPDGNMRYDDLVTRAECVKIAVAASAYRDSVATGSKTSPFSDVPYTHWASPYISVGVKNGLCKGYLDATFRPDNTVLYEEAATMFLRILGYTDEDFGGNWPDGQVGIAKNIGILDNIDKSIGDELSRRDLAAMAYNTLIAKTNTTPQATHLSTFNRTIVDDVVMIATMAEDPTIAEGKILTSSGTYNFADTLDTTQIGKRGSIVLRNNDTIVSFIPEIRNSDSELQMVYATLSNGIVTYKDGAFHHINVPANTVFYKDSSTISAATALSTLEMGDVLRIKYKSNDEIDYIMCTKGSTSGPKTVTSSDWYSYFGTDSSVTVMRDGVKSSVADVKINDITYYSKELDMAFVYSKKITGIYESATPNKDTPASVTVSGITYNIEGIDAFSKLSSAGSFNYGDTVTLLLGKSGDVADVVTNAQLSETVYGFMTEAGSKQTTISGNTVTKPYVKVVLPSGEAYEYVTTKDLSDSNMKNSVVCVTLENGAAIVTSVSDNDTVSGEFTWNSGTRKIGNSKLASDVEILEVSTTDAYETAITDIVFPQRLNGTKLSTSSVLYAHKNRDGYVDTLIINNITGDIQHYGILSEAKNNTSEFAVSGSYEHITNGYTYRVSTVNAAYNVSRGQVVKISAEYLENVNQFVNYTSITPIDKVASGKITDITGSEVTIGGKTYTMSDKVQLYVKKSYEYTMLTLDELKGMMSDYSAAIYQDKSESSGGRVRVIVLS